MRRLIITCLAPAILLALVVSSVAFAQSSSNFAIRWHSINSGGVQGLSSSSFRLSGTLGQAAAGYASSANYRHWVGFWVKEGPGAVTPVGSLDEAKLLPDGSSVSFTGKVATSGRTDFAGLFYVEEPNRSSGIRVATSTLPTSLARAPRRAHIRCSARAT